MARAVRSGGRVVVSDLHPDAMRAGWKRSFRRGEDIVEIDYDPASDAELRSAGAELGLLLRRHASVHFGPTEQRIFQGAGKEDEFESARAIPAISIYHWIKP